MEMNLFDLLDGVDASGVTLRETRAVSAERVKEIAMKKIQNETKRKHIRRPLVLALAAALTLVLGATAFAAVKWHGYADISGMSRRERAALLDEVSRAAAGASQDADGNVTYYDAAGDPMMTLTAGEAARYERERQEAHDRAVIESTTLVDASTIPLLPNTITEIAVDADGRLADFALGNGAMLVLHPEGADGWTLRRGDRVTLSLDASDVCYLQFGFFRDGVFSEAETLHEKSLSYTYDIAEDGAYCFAVEYCSAGADAFNNARLTVH